MYHENTNQIHLALFILCVLSATFSPPYNQSSAQQNVIKEATGGMASGVDETVQNTESKEQKTGVPQTSKKGNNGMRKSNQGSGGTDTQSQQICDKECKVEKLIGIGIREEIAISLVENCKALADDPINCIKIGAFISMSESGGGMKCKSSNKYNCFGLSVNEKYNSYNDGVLHFIGKYNRFWFRQSNPNSFYSNSPNWQPVTRFCLSEYSSGLPYCKNGHRIAWNVFNKLNF